MDLQWFPSNFIPGVEAVVVVIVVVVDDVVDVEVVAVGVMPMVVPGVLGGISNKKISPPGAEGVPALLGGRNVGGGRHEKAN